MDSSRIMNSEPVTEGITQENYAATIAKLCINGHVMSLDLDTHLPRLTPLLTKAKKVAKRQPVPPHQPKEWWQAQCAFRGLHQSGTVTELQNRLRGLNPRDEQAKAAEYNAMSRAVSEYEEAVRRHMEDVSWRAATNVHEKANINITRLLAEHFTSGGSEENVLALKVRDDLIYKASSYCARNELCFDSTNAPTESCEYSGYIWVVVGRLYRQVSDRIGDILQQNACQAQKAKDLQAEVVRLRCEAVRARNATKPPNNWDVTGVWQVECPEMEKGYGRPADGYSMKIYRTKTDPSDDEDTDQEEEKDYYGLDRDTDGEGESDDDHEKEAERAHRGARQTTQLWVTFHINIIEGVIRFMNPNAPTEKDYSRNDFDLESNELPGPTNTKFTYRWRGRATSEGEIELHCDNKCLGLSFGNYGTTFIAVLESTYGTFSLSGVKVDSTEPGERGVGSQCGDFSEDAYNSACAARWGGWRGWR